MGHGRALRRGIAGVACLAVAVVCAGLFAPAGRTRARSQPVPKAVTLVIRRFAGADAYAQAVDAPAKTRALAAKYLRQLHADPSALSIAPSAAVTVRRFISQDEAAAQYTKRVSGFAWDIARVQLSRPETLAQSADRLTVTMAVTELFHIQRMPRSWRGQNYSATGEPYRFTFHRSGPNTWRLTALRHEGPYD